MNQTRIDELKALLDFAGRQSKTKAQLESPDGSVDKNEIEILAGVMKEVLDTLVTKTNVPVATPVVSPVAKPIEAAKPVATPVATPEIKK